MTRITCLFVLAICLGLTEKTSGQTVSYAAGAFGQPATSETSFEERLQAIEDENARLRSESIQLRAETDRLRELIDSSEINNAGDIEQTSFLTPSPHSCDGCRDCGETNREGPLGRFCFEEMAWKKGNGWKIVPFGRLRADYIYSSAAYTNDAVIVFLNPRSPGISEDSTSLTAKQSQINFALTGPTYQGWETGGIVLINFMGQQPLRNFSGANIVLAYGEIKNDGWRVAFGRMLDLFGPINSTTVNQMQQRGAGNIGIYRGALNIDRYLTLSDTHKWTLSGRISQPDISDYAAVPLINGQNNGWPNIEARVGVELGATQEFGRPIEVGISGVVGELQAVLPAIAGGLILPGADETIQVGGACIDAQIRGEIFGFRGEVWWGKSAGTYFVASLQSINPETDQAIESVGGWAEIYCNLTSCLKTHVGYGLDDPRNDDLGFLDITGPGQISFNDVAWWNVIYNVTDHFEVGLEVSHRRTRFLQSANDNEGTQCHVSTAFNF
ncbi:MAG: hypothetical protein AAGG48_06255 [Planctomycetota bacterium]